MTSDSARGHTATDAPGQAATRRVGQRIAFVLILVGLGAVVAGVVTAQMQTRFDAEAVVAVDPTANIDEVVSAARQGLLPEGEQGRVQVSERDANLVFTGQSELAADAALLANSEANRFVVLADDPAVRVLTDATAPSNPASPRLLLAVLIGMGIGGLLGLGLQDALVSRSEPGVSYIPAWSSEDNEPDFEPDPAPAEALGRWVDLDFDGDGDPEDPGEPDSWAADEPFGQVIDAEDRFSNSTTLFADRDIEAVADTEAAAEDEAAGRAELDAAPDDSSTEADPSDPTTPADADEPTGAVETGETDEAGEPSSSVGFDEPGVLDEAGDADEPSSSVGFDEPSELDEAGDATFGSSPDPDEATIDRAAGLAEPTELAAPAEHPGLADDLAGQPGPTEPATVGFQSLVGADSDERPRPWDRDPTGEIEGLGTGFLDEDQDLDPSADEASRLSAELRRYQRMLDHERRNSRLSREHRDETHQLELDELTFELQRAQADIERLRSDRDLHRSRLEDRIGELETELAARQGELTRLKRARTAAGERQRIHDDDLLVENEFLRSEVERYQSTVDDERLRHTTALTETRVEHQREIDQIHRDHRVALNQVSHANRNLLATHRRESQAQLAAVEAEHQRRLDLTQADYEQRLRDARGHFEHQLATADERAEAAMRSDRERIESELRALIDQLRDDNERLDEQLAETQQRADALGRRAVDGEQNLEREIRARDDRIHRSEARVSELESQLSTSEERLAAERRRTNAVVRNLLTESASSVATAERARQHEADGRAALEANHQQQVNTLIAEARALEAAAAEREALLEATIASLRSERI